MAASTVARSDEEVGKPTNLGGRPEVLTLDAEAAMNATALLDDVAKAAEKAKNEAVDRYNDIIRKALRTAVSDDIITCAKRARFDAIERYDDVIKKAINAKKSLASSISKYNGEKSRRAA